MKSSFFNSKKVEGERVSDPDYLENREDKDYLINQIASVYFDSDYESVTGSVYTVFLLLAAVVFILRVVSFPPKWWIAVLYLVGYFVAAYIVSWLIWLVLDKHKKIKKKKVLKA